MHNIPGAKKIENELLSLQKRKDAVLDISREVIRLCGRSITLMHAGRMREASAGIKRLDAMVSTLRKAEKGFEYFSLPAHQEYVEARAFYTILKERRLPRLGELRTSSIAYLLGLMDLVGELRRETLEAIREKRADDANMCYSLMRAIYDSTRGMRFANSLVPEFRRKQDVARMQIESTASELLSVESKKRYV